MNKKIVLIIFPFIVGCTKQNEINIDQLGVIEGLILPSLKKVVSSEELSLNVVYQPVNPETSNSMFRKKSIRDLIDASIIKDAIELKTLEKYLEKVNDSIKVPDAKGNVINSAGFNLYLDNGIYETELFENERYGTLDIAPYYYDKDINFGCQYYAIFSCPKESSVGKCLFFELSEDGNYLITNSYTTWTWPCKEADR